MIRDVHENFSTKKEVKKMNNILERKLIKFEMIEEILKGSDDGDPKLTVTSSGFHNRTKPVSIHTTNKKIEKGEKLNVKSSESIHIRKISKVGAQFP